VRDAVGVTYEDAAVPHRPSAYRATLIAAALACTPLAAARAAAPPAWAARETPGEWPARAGQGPAAAGRAAPLTRPRRS